MAERPPRAYGEPALLGVSEPTQTCAGIRIPIDGLARNAGSRREDPSDAAPERLPGQRCQQGGVYGVVKQGGPSSKAAGMRSKLSGATPGERGTAGGLDDILRRFLERRLELGDFVRHSLLEN